VLVTGLKRVNHYIECCPIQRRYYGSDVRVEADVLHNEATQTTWKHGEPKTRIKNRKRDSSALKSFNHCTVNEAAMIPIRNPDSTSLLN